MHDIDFPSMVTHAPIHMAIMAIVTSLLVGLLVREKTKPKVNYPPYPEPLHFLWGNAAELPKINEGKHFDPKFLEWAKELGPVFSIKVPIMGTMIVVADPKLAHHICVSKNFKKAPTYKSWEPVFGDRSILISEGDKWKRLRKTFAPGFTPSFLQDMVSVICDKMERFTKCIDEDIAEKSDVTHMMSRAQTFTSDVIVQIAFGEDWGGGSTPHQARVWLNEITILGARMVNDPIGAMFRWDEAKRRKECEKKLDNVMREVLQRRLDDQNADDEKKGIVNICSMAIQSMKQADGNLTAEDCKVIMHQLKTFYFGGHDTTATTIAWAVWLLSQNPQVLETLRAELRNAKIFNTPDQRPTYKDLQNCEYLDAVLKEVLRLYPPGATARSSTNLNETWEGYTIGGAVLYVVPYVMHRLPQYWEKPEEFVPERFVGVPPESYAHKYIPFLKGPRDCIGKYFAVLESKLAIAALAQRYDMACVDPNEGIAYRMTAIPMDGAKMKFKERLA